MAQTPTTQIPLFFKAPAFKLPDTVSNKDLTFEDIKGTNGTLVFFYLQSLSVCGSCDRRNC
jgi:peroxiredoxin